ncbi:MAG TPA: GNAT family N-acetyltransferase, partial [Ruminococcaceae bacterium]|nr:GNAT family N-acetyltransferase [Oscillospiraceae bacterium]
GGEYVSYCCLWYSDKTDYAYVEPVCTVPSCRGKGVAKAVIYEALNRAKSLGAKKAYVLSDMPFYKQLGFTADKHFSFLWK